VKGFELSVKDVGFGVKGRSLGFKVVELYSPLGVEDSVEALRCKVQSFGFRVQGFR
jgi:hypothetical protein